MCSGLVFKAHRLCVRLCVSFNSWLESDKETEKYEHDRGNLVFSASGEEPHGGSRFVYPSSGHRGKFRPPWSSPNALGRPQFALGGVNVIPRWARTSPAGLARASHAVNSDSGVQGQLLGTVLFVAWHVRRHSGTSLMRDIPPP